MNNLKILNVFGIKPATTGVSAGMDFFIPKFNGMENSDAVLAAFEKSYGFKKKTMLEMIDALILEVSAQWGPEYMENNELNLLQLFLALDSPFIDHKFFTADQNASIFVDQDIVPNLLASLSLVIFTFASYFALLYHSDVYLLSMVDL